MMQSNHVLAGAMPASDESSRLPEERNLSGHSERLRVCLITTEFHGLFKNGGIGTANTGLALALAGAGFDVTVAFADADESGPRIREGNFPDLQEKYKRLGITLDYVPVSPSMHRAFDDPRSASYCVYLYLKQRSFDVVYFNDCGGHGFYALQAKHTGVFPNAPIMYVVAHGPHEWVLELNSLRYWNRTPIITAYLERRCIALADALISPSKYLVDWMIAHHWVMPARVYVIQNIVRLPDAVMGLTSSVTPVETTEIVFFGRLEVRKGIELFCDAIDLLNKSTDLSKIRITFMGKFSHVAGLHSGMYVIERAHRWRSSLRVISTFGQEEALHYLSKPGIIAVIPSNAENSPCVVMECLQLGITFLATDSGGTAELISLEDRNYCLFAATPQALKASLIQVLSSPHGPARLAVSQEDSQAQWMQLTRTGTIEPSAENPLSSIALQHEGSRENTTQPKVSICLTSAALSPAAGAFMESLLQQNYQNLELIVCDDGESNRSRIEAFCATAGSISVHALNGSGVDRGVQRNAAAAKASGEYLFFVEESNIVLIPSCIDVLVTAALRTNADIVTAIPLQFHQQSTLAGELEYFPIGACLELGGFENCFGKDVVLVARRNFEQSGGFAASCDQEIEDWLFLATLALAGLTVEVVPELIFHERIEQPVGLNRSSIVDNHRRILDAYSGQKLEIFRHMIESSAHVDPAKHERRHSMPESINGEARRIALHVSSSFEPNSENGLRGFVQYCIERHKVQEALDFAFYNKRSLLTDIVESAKVVTETLALDTVRGHMLDLWYEVSLTDDVRQRIKSVSAFPVRDYTQTSERIASYALDAGVSILKAAASCPPGARSIRAHAQVKASSQPVFLALVAAASNARLRLSEQGLESKEDFSWSQWVPVSEENQQLDLVVSMPQAIEEIYDLHFLCKVMDDGARPQGQVMWETVTATVSINGVTTPGAIELTEVATPVPRRVLEQGIVLTESPEFPYPVFVPGEPTLLHPLPGKKTSLVRISGALPAGAKGIRSVVSLELAGAHPTQFAVWARTAGTPAMSEADLKMTDTFSGWFSVRDTFRRHSFTVSLKEPAAEAMDLYLATRVVEYSDVHYCHAVWHEVLVLE